MERYRVHLTMTQDNQTMNIKHIASGSSGNAILVDDGITKILFDAGISFRELSRAVKLTDIEAVFITHEHNDHCRAVPKLLQRGVTVYMSAGTKSTNARFWEARTITTRNSPVKAGSWYVQAFDVVHDAKEPIGFVFGNGVHKGVYIVDSGRIHYQFTGITHWVIEANYSQSILTNNSQYHPGLKNRIRNNHFSIEELITFFTEHDSVTGKPVQDLSQTEEIHLVHLSESNSNEQQFVQRLEEETGVPVYVIQRKRNDLR